MILRNTSVIIPAPSRVASRKKEIIGNLFICRSQAGCSFCSLFYYMPESLTHFWVNRRFQGFLQAGSAYIKRRLRDILIVE
jgi:hypothetical protein